jgi:hypothetical protein
MASNFLGKKGTNCRFVYLGLQSMFFKTEVCWNPKIKKLPFHLLLYVPRLGSSSLILFFLFTWQKKA